MSPEQEEAYRALSPGERVFWRRDSAGEVALGELRWQTRDTADGRLEVVCRVSDELVVVVDAGALARLARLWVDDALDAALLPGDDVAPDAGAVAG